MSSKWRSWRRVAALSLLSLWCAGVKSTAALVSLHRNRQSPSDLEVGGSLAGIPRGETRFVTFADLARLPLETYTVIDDAGLGKTVRITGIAVERLPALLGAARGANMVTALCSDAYAAHYPASYLRAHHPVLVMRLDGKTSAKWRALSNGEAMGPYLISHPMFLPSFRVLSHEDEAQVPWGVVRIDFEDENRVYAPIEPIGPHAHDVNVQKGYAIARQNCFRCHSRGGEGGEKSKRPWDVVARRAVTDPRYFDEYVRHPRRLNPASQMAASPGYDDATLLALRAYFKPFSESHP
jgi:mono/diheme cytochrome c family protein